MLQPSEYWDEMAKKYPAQVNERELFLTKQTETISATQVPDCLSLCDLYWLVHSMWECVLTV